MLEGLPIALPIAFALITFATFILSRRVILKSSPPPKKQNLRTLVVGMLTWLVTVLALSLLGVYSKHPEAMPPRIFIFGVLPMLMVIAAAFFTRSGRRFIDSLSLFHLTLLHTIRIFVELVLWWLFLEGAVPQLMTFEGRNLDILAGLTAPLVAYLGIRKEVLSRRMLIIWNILCLGLLFNIVIIAVLSVPSPLQKLGFEQPNRAVLYFPFTWLPAFVVPAVLFCHLAAIRKLLTGKKINEPRELHEGSPL
jgi:hypothetical protein